ncbi:MAG: carbohydrate ABC transporter permease [Stappiaceae bacterium]
MTIATTEQTLPSSQELGAMFWRFVLYAGLVLLGFFFIVPLAIVLLTSLRGQEEILKNGVLALPSEVSLRAWWVAFNESCVGTDCRGMAPYFWNSVKLVIPATVISTALGAITGYALTKYKFRGSEFFFAATIFGIFLPAQLFLLPTAQLLGLLSATNIWGLVLIHNLYGLAFTTLFFRNFYVQIPDEIISAARIDGAGFFAVFWRIIVPLSPPIIVVTVIWQFTHIWNEFLYGATFTTGTDLPITAALYAVTGPKGGIRDYGVEAAAVVIAALPTLAVYIVAGKYFVRGLTSGSLKG